jgi:hypothetical protein
MPRFKASVIFQLWNFPLPGPSWAKEEAENNRNIFFQTPRTGRVWVRMLGWGGLAIISLSYLIQARV